MKNLVFFGSKFTLGKTYDKKIKNKKLSQQNPVIISPVYARKTWKHFKR
jgi:hypothetical protein